MLSKFICVRAQNVLFRMGHQFERHKSSHEKIHFANLLPAQNAFSGYAHLLKGNVTKYVDTDTTCKLAIVSRHRTFILAAIPCTCKEIKKPSFINLKFFLSYL